MRYFKHIDIDNYQKVLDNSTRFVSENYLTSQSSSFQQFDWTTYVSYCPEILTAFSKYDLEPYAGFVYIIYNQDESPLHTDYVSDVHNKCRINIPIFNCEFSRTFYYRKTTEALEQERVVQKNSMFDAVTKTKFINYIKYKEDDPSLEKVDEVVVDRPTIMRVQEPHRVMIDSNHVPRVVLTIHTRKDPAYLLDDDTC